MASRETENFKLNQWDAEDSVLREDFNRDNRKIDEALRAVAPAGLIAMWSGAATAIPEGWTLCDGQNGTPDLRDRFIVGAGSGYQVGEKGGTAIENLADYRESSGSLFDHIFVYTKNTHDNRPPYYALCYIMRL